MAVEPPLPNPERDNLETLVSIVEKRVARAAEKRRAVDHEMNEALDALEAAQWRLSMWITANPDPQGELL